MRGNRQIVLGAAVVGSLFAGFLSFTFSGQAAEPTSATPAAPRYVMGEFKKPSAEELKKRLTPEQFKVTQEEGTERPFKNEYWDNHEEGLYVDVVSGEPLFSSKDKFDSGTGWPSFTRPLEKDAVVEKRDRTLWMERVEIRSKQADSHLGHVFDDGPAPTGLRYCMNSASLRFVPVSQLEAQGYGKYAALFGAAAGSGTKKETKVADREEAVLAGGCFWGMEDLIRKIPGVIETEVGYAGGTMSAPTYRDVSSGGTGHAESVKIVFDPKKVSFEEILGHFFRMHDPTTVNRQGNDVGSQYRSAIFVQSPEQKRVAEEVKKKVDASGKWKKPIVTEIVEGASFYKGEDYHQDYLVKNPGGYTCHFYRD